MGEVARPGGSPRRARPKTVTALLYEYVDDNDRSRLCSYCSYTTLHKGCACLCVFLNTMLERNKTPSHNSILLDSVHNVTCSFVKSCNTVMSSNPTNVNSITCPASKWPGTKDVKYQPLTRLSFSLEKNLRRSRPSSLARKTKRGKKASKTLPLHTLHAATTEKEYAWRVCSNFTAGNG